MNLNSLNVILAQAPPAGQANPTGSIISMLGYVGILIAMFYLVAIRPQQKRAKELNNMLQTLKAGDKIVTSSGIIGTVVSVKEKSIAIRSAETKLEVLKSSISDITERAGAAQAEES